MGYLYVGFNKTEDFKILICAYNEREASKLSEDYRTSADLRGKFEISEVNGSVDLSDFDCDYVITG